MVGFIRSEQSAGTFSGEAPEVADPLEGLTSEVINNPETNAFVILLNLLHRLPKDLRPPFSANLLNVAWNLVTTYNAKDRILPFRAEYYRQHNKGGNSNTTAANSNINSSKANTNPAIRNLDGHWRSKPSRGSSTPTFGGTLPEEKLSSEPPPLPAYQKNIFQHRDHNNNVDFHKENPGLVKLHPGWNVIPTTPVTEAPKATATTPGPRSARSRSMYSSDDDDEMVGQKSPQRSHSSVGRTPRATAVASAPTTPKATKSPKNTSVRRCYTPKNSSSGRYLASACDNLPEVDFDAKWSSDELEEKAKAKPKSKHFGVAPEEAAINPQPRIVKTVQFDPDEISPVNTLSIKQVRPAKNGAFLIPQYDNADLHTEQNEEYYGTPVVVAPKPRSKSVNSNSAGFDWTTETEGCRESFDNQFVIQLAYGKLPAKEDDEVESASGQRLRQQQQQAPVVEAKKQKPTSESNAFRSLRSELTVGSTARVKIVDEIEMPRYRPPPPRPSTSRGAYGTAAGSPFAAKYTSPVPVVDVGNLNDDGDEEKEEAGKDAKVEKKDRFAHHKKTCVLCLTDEHTTVDCPESPPSKMVLIRELELCKKCLESGHTASDCFKFGKVLCVTCGLDHLDYIFHKPVNWMFNRYKKAEITDGEVKETTRQRRMSQSSDAFNADLAEDGDAKAIREDVENPKASSNRDASTPLPTVNNFDFKNLLDGLLDCSTVDLTTPLQPVANNSQYLISFEDSFINEAK